MYLTYILDLLLLRYHVFLFCILDLFKQLALSANYSKIPILRPPLGLSKSGLKDHFWTVPKVVSNQRNTGCRK